MTLNKTLLSTFTAIILSFSSVAAFAADKHDMQTLVMDIEITGDSSVKGDKEDNLKKSPISAIIFVANYKIKRHLT